MATEIRMPQLGESVVEGTVARWLKAPGDEVDKLEPLIEINTDKIDTEIPSPAAGVLLEIMVPAGKTVRAGAILGLIGRAGEPHSSGALVEPSDMPEPAQEAPTGAAPAGSGSNGHETGHDGTPAPRPREDVRPSGKAFISPVVARMAAEHQIDLAEVAGTGLGGRITKQDMLAFLAGQQQKATPAPPSAPVAASARSVQASPDGMELAPDESLVPLTAMRRIIAEHMVVSKRTSPHVTTVFEVDMTAVVRHRETHKDDYSQKGIKLTYTPYFVAAAAQALRNVPEVNSRFHEDGEKSGIILNRRIHIGIAVALPQGLVVPVIRDADERNLQGLARAVSRTAEDARQGRLEADSLRGGTFTITNHGVTGSLLGTPVINQPQAAILGVGAIVKRPVVQSSGGLLPSADDAIVIRPMCYLSLTFDHRVLDGAKADEFMSRLKAQLQEWSQIDN
jgi:2-oxoisovalerate dehydrogenase E2 component (dihydrolipoyl transacylase)